jgi:membrane protease YdiL (CAAX protease family)
MMMVLSSTGIDIETLRLAAETEFTKSESQGIKLALGLNHFISFVCSGIVLIYLFSKRKWKTYTGITKKFDPALFFKFLILLLLSYPVFSAIIVLFQNLPLPDWAIRMDNQNLGTLERLLAMDNPADYVVNLVIIAVFAGVGEETIFRGVIQKELYQYVKPFYAILISATIFGLFHFEITGLIPKIMIGAIMGFAYYITSNLLYPVLIHFVNNGVQVSILYFTGLELGASNVPEEPSLALALTSGLIFMPIAYFYGRYLYQNNNLYGQDA